MKLTDYAIVFIMVILPFILILRIQSDNLQNIACKNTMINRYLDTAAEDASEAMIIRGDNMRVEISREKAERAFYATLFTNFNIPDSLGERERLAAFIPVLVLIDYDGYSVCSMETYTNKDGDQEQKMVWKPKKSYAMERDGYIYIFTLDQKVTVYHKNTGEFFEGRRQALETVVPNGIMQDEALFDTLRKRTIVNSIQADVNLAINQHNTYAARYGITYHFTPPSLSDGDWYRNIEDVGFLAFFQGLPIGLNGEYYNHFALGAARIVRKSPYYIQEDQNHKKYYHREQCELLTQKDKAYDTREACALKGAFPCPVCKP